MGSTLVMIVLCPDPRIHVHVMRSARKPFLTRLGSAHMIMNGTKTWPAIFKIDTAHYPKRFFGLWAPVVRKILMGECL